MGKKTKILYFIIGVTLIGLLVFGGYKFYQSKTIIEKFGAYIEEYKKEISMYDLIDKESEYTQIITESEQALSEKNHKSIPDLKERAELLKEELLKNNIEIAEDKIKQLESIDISKLDNKDFINSSIEKLKKLKKSNNFIKVNEIYNSLSEEINVKLTEIEEIEKQKKKEELLNNIDGLYKYEEVNKNGVSLNEVNISLISYNENKLSISGGYNYIVNINYGNIDVNEATEEDLEMANIRSGSIGGELHYVDNLKWSGYIWDDSVIGLFNELSKKVSYNNGFFPTMPITITMDENGLITTTVNEASHIQGNHIFSKYSDEEVHEYGIKIQDEKIKLEEGPKVTVREAYDLVNQHGNPPEEYEELDIIDTVVDINDIGYWWFDFPEGEYYYFIYTGPFYFYVDKESGLVYSHPSQIGLPIYLMKNGEIEKTYEWNNESYESLLE